MGVLHPIHKILYRLHFRQYFRISSLSPRTQYHFCCRLRHPICRVPPPGRQPHPRRRPRLNDATTDQHLKAAKAKQHGWACAARWVIPPRGIPPGPFRLSGTRACFVLIESERGSRFLFSRVFFTRTGIHFARKRSNGETKKWPSTETGISS